MLKTGKSKVNANASGQSDDTTITDPGPGPEDMVKEAKTMKTMKTMKTSSSSSSSPLPEDSSEHPNHNADVNALGLSTPTQSTSQTQRDDRHSVDSTDRSTTTKAKPAHTHETTPQAPDEAHREFISVHCLLPCHPIPFIHSNVHIILSTVCIFEAESIFFFNI
jgi:hypothetical protein